MEDVSQIQFPVVVSCLWFSITRELAAYPGFGNGFSGSPGKEY
jgi:hypothetical protein